ncbi:MAG: type II toxin-antitoxin system HicA family toxin [Acidobacteria bacterium]|nr:type II toxin-antitoxin system HicA family toxin [Acidobacteriota bacterium]
MKLDSLLRHLRRHGCVLMREGGRHAIWGNPQTGEQQAVPRHTEIYNTLAKIICRGLSVPDPPG